MSRKNKQSASTFFRHQEYVKPNHDPQVFKTYSTEEPRKLYAKCGGGFRVIRKALGNS